MPPADAMPRVGYAISSVDGTPLYYELGAPKPDRMPIILCDGIGCDGFIWKYLKPELERDHQVLRWHYRGHGRSAQPKASDKVGMENLSDDLASVMDDAGIDEAIIVGHSMGVQVALEFHRRHRYRSKALVLMCGAHSDPLKTFKGSDFLEGALPMMRKTLNKAPGLFRSIGQAMLPRDWVYRLATKFEFQEQLLSHRDFMPYLKSLAQMDPVLFLAMLSQMAEHSTRDLLPEIRIPTLVISGQLDTFTPPALGREMADMIRGAQYVEVDEGTHSTPLEHPVLVGEVTIDFLCKVAAEEFQ